MALYTDRKYYMDTRLVEKLDVMVHRMTKKNFDNLLLVDGDEGYGKSNLAVGVCYYIHDQTGRPFTVDNVFFDLDELIRFASTTKEQIILWDEGALGGLAVNWWAKNQQKFLQLVMVARKKKHFIMICIPKFFKLNEYLVVDRSIALIHTYARNETQLGRFVYYNKKAKENLYYDWKRTKKRNYKKRYTFHGGFVQTIVNSKLIDEEAYEAKKDHAIASLATTDKPDKYLDQRNRLLKYIHDTQGLGPKAISEDIKQVGFTLDSTGISRILAAFPKDKEVWMNNVA